ncbi:hypothetical protein ACFLRF_01880 [Candidatus Altiarchaeota archaeon]
MRANEQPKTACRKTAVLILIAALSIALSSAQSTQISLDIGNDTASEWSMPYTFTGPVRTHNLASDIQNYVSTGCTCNGCYQNLIAQTCVIPVIFRSGYSGNLSINDVQLSYYRAFILANVSYGNSFRTARGDCWSIEDLSGINVHHIPDPAGCLNNPQFTQAIHLPPASQDAIDDAVWRLLDEELDNNDDYRVDLQLSDNKSIQSKGLLGVQSLWGPSEMRLVVWI